MEPLGQGQPSEWEVSISEAWREAMGGPGRRVGQIIKGGDLERQPKVSGTPAKGHVTVGLKTRPAFKLLEESLVGVGGRREIRALSLETNTIR